MAAPAVCGRGVELLDRGLSDARVEATDGGVGCTAARLRGGGDRGGGGDLGGGDLGGGDLGGDESACGGRRCAGEACLVAVTRAGMLGRGAIEFAIGGR